MEAMLGVFHGARLRELDARYGGSIIDAQIARALADAPWPDDLLADVAGVAHRRLRPARGRTRRATSTTASIWSRSRYARERPIRRRGRSARALHPRPAHPPAVAGPPRPLAGRRGMALPVLVGGIPAADPGAAHAGRRGPPRPGHPGHDAGGHRPAGRPVLPRRHAPLAGELAAARASRRTVTRLVGVVARLRNSRARRGRAGARRLHRRSGGTAPARCCAN